MDISRIFRTLNPQQFILYFSIVCIQFVARTPFYGIWDALLCARLIENYTLFFTYFIVCRHVAAAANARQTLFYGGNQTEENQNAQ